MTTAIITDAAEREAILGLWAVPGLGNSHLAAARALTGDRLASLLSVPVAEWEGDLKLERPARDFLSGVETLEQLAAMVRRPLKASKTNVAFAGDPDYPENLLGIPDGPPVLFHWGKLGAPRSRVAMVGSRGASGAVLQQATLAARRLATAGLGIVSGGAHGVDQASHDGALAVGGETWVFVACSLDRLDTPQWELAKKVWDRGGAIFSEYPPNTASQRGSFPRRNRLISGAADAVLIVRARRKSGTLHTAVHAIRQGRPLLAMPGEVWEEDAWGCHDLLRSGQARICACAEDVFTALRLVPERMAPPPPAGRSLDELGLSDPARQVFGALRRDPQVFEEILAAVRMDAARLISALSELELFGVAVQHPGKQYVRA